jgi:murein DD-endopeptidase MepM/ murein hydrolase activator NlpD
MLERPRFFCRVRRLSFLLSFLLTACAAESTPVRFAPAADSYYTVMARAGDSVAVLAQRYSVKQDDVLALNRIADPKKLNAGQAIRVPAYGRLRAEDRAPPQAVARPAPPSVPAPVPTREAANLQTADAPVVAVPRPARIQAEPLKQPGTEVAGVDMNWLSSFTSDMPDPKIGMVKFLWPVKGRVIANFGASGSGERNDGIDISAVRGAPIRAAADGTVSYVGDELKAYGNLILIRHPNGFVTAYAHADSVAVMRGQEVKRGQVIAYAGTTGDVSEPQLHFELRAGNKAIDPQPYLVAAN